MGEDGVVFVAINLESPRLIAMRPQQWVMPYVPGRPLIRLPGFTTG
jgi:hypothetical protein